MKLFDHGVVWSAINSVSIPIQFDPWGAICSWSHKIKSLLVGDKHHYLRVLPQRTFFIGYIIIVIGQNLFGLHRPTNYAITSCDKNEQSI